jgi:ketosteroid isomerase-like protein
MKTIRTTACVFGIVLLAAVMSASGSRVAADAAIDPEVLVAREAAWRAFYDGDVKALGDVLPEDFIGINMNDGPFANRAQILDAARVFRERGGRLVRLSFPETQAQRFGDVVVLYGRFEVVSQSGGAERTRRGRLTEIFVRRDGKLLPRPGRAWLGHNSRSELVTSGAPAQFSPGSHHQGGQALVGTE